MGNMQKCTQCGTFHYRNDPCPEKPEPPRGRRDMNLVACNQRGRCGDTLCEHYDPHPKTDECEEPGCCSPRTIPGDLEDVCCKPVEGDAGT